MIKMENVIENKKNYKIELNRNFHSNNNGSKLINKTNNIFMSNLLIVFSLFMMKIIKLLKLFNSKNFKNNNNKKLVFYLLLTSTILIQSRKVSPKKFEAFCRNYPLHRLCMGAFAGGGKRSFDMPERSGLKNYNRQNILENLALKLDLESLPYQKVAAEKNSQEFNDPEFNDKESSDESPNTFRDDKLDLKRKILLLKLLSELNEDK